MRPPQHDGGARLHQRAACLVAVQLVGQQVEAVQLEEAVQLLEARPVQVHVQQLRTDELRSLQGGAISGILTTGL